VPVDYEGGRTKEDLVTFINEKTGLARAFDGSLQPSAGRVNVFDIELKAKNFLPDDFLFEIFDRELGRAEHAAAKAAIGLYIQIAKKVQTKGAKYAETELARIQKLVLSPTIKQKDKVKFQYKETILKAFFA
jgi:hypothetical protein